MNLISTNQAAVSNTLACAIVLVAGSPMLSNELVRTDINPRSHQGPTNRTWTVISNSEGADVFLNDIGSDKYNLARPVRLTISQPDEDGYVISFPEAAILVAGDTADEALRWMKNSIVTIYETLKSEHALGPLPARQLKALENYLGSKSSSKA